MTDRLRDLAGKIDRATPGPWEKFGLCIHKAIRTDIPWVGCADVTVIGEGFIHKIRGMTPDEAHQNVEAICLARNEAPALLREAADEIERLRSIAKIMATAIWYRHDTPEATMTANEFLNDPTTKEAQ